MAERLVPFSAGITANVVQGDLDDIHATAAAFDFGILYDTGFRHDPERPLESLAEYCLGCYTNLSLPARIDLLERYIKTYSADGFLINSVKSCNSFSAGQLMMLRELEKRTGVAGGFIESDLVDPRYFGKSNIENRLQSFLQMLGAKRERSCA